MAISFKTGKRCAEVMTSDMVAHVWAAKSQDAARTSTGNMYFSAEDSATVWSYGRHFAIARFTGKIISEEIGNGIESAKRKREIVLLNVQGYSPTTQGHKRDVENALRGHLVKTFYVKYPTAERKSDHVENCTDFLERIEALIVQAIKARGSAKWNMDSAKALHASATEYGKIFLKRKGKSFDKVFSDVVKKHSAKTYADLITRGKAHTTPANEPLPLSALEMFVHDCLEKKQKHDKAMELRAQNASERELIRREAQKIAQAERDLQIPIDRADWLSGKDVNYPSECKENHYYNYSGQTNPHKVEGVEFRVIRGGAVTQSSLGAEVPTKQVKALFVKLYEMINLPSEEKKVEFISDVLSKSPDIGSFTLTSIEPNGDFRAGCHSVKWKNVVDFATRLGWMNSDGSLNSIGINYVP